MLAAPTTAPMRGEADSGIETAYYAVSIQKPTGNRFQTMVVVAGIRWLHGGDRQP
jgi:hypothetical protein